MASLFPITTCKLPPLLILNPLTSASLKPSPPPPLPPPPQVCRKAPKPSLNLASWDDPTYLIVWLLLLTTTTGSTINLARGGGGEATGIASATDLSIFTGSPKLEDFLGGSCTATPPQPPQVQLGHHHLSSATTAHEIYDSELKTIAASFLRGFATEQTDIHHQQQQQQQHLKHHHQQQQQLVPLVAQPAPKKTVDTFGQRTSIYRGVTRYI